MKKKIQLPLTKEQRRELRAGDQVLISGVIYTARDAAHKRITESLQGGGTPPFELRDAVIYYTGPSPAKPGQIIGAAGPTTSYRMDPYTPALLDLGLGAMIGKGPRNPQVVDAMVRNGAVYFAAIGGAGALIAKSITKADTLCYEDLGTEAVRKLEVKDFPAIVAIDSRGGNLYLNHNPSDES